MGFFIRWTRRTCAPERRLREREACSRARCVDEIRNREPVSDLAPVLRVFVVLAQHRLGQTAACAVWGVHQNTRSCDVPSAISNVVRIAARSMGMRLGTVLVALCARLSVCGGQCSTRRSRSCFSCPRHPHLPREAARTRARAPISATMSLAVRLVERRSDERVQRAWGPVERDQVAQGVRVTVQRLPVGDAILDLRTCPTSWFPTVQIHELL